MRMIAGDNVYKDGSDEKYSRFIQKENGRALKQPHNIAVYLNNQNIIKIYQTM